MTQGKEKAPGALAASRGLMVRVRTSTYKAKTLKVKTLVYL
jgi:hypothetical protein